MTTIWNPTQHRERVLIDLSGDVRDRLVKTVKNVKTGGPILALYAVERVSVGTAWYTEKGSSDPKDITTTTALFSRSFNFVGDDGYTLGGQGQLFLGQLEDVPEWLSEILHEARPDSLK